MKIELAFPGGVAVDAAFNGHVVHTDQLPPAGAGSGPSPFDLFLASIATCMGFYALRFCQERSLSTEGLGLTLEPIRSAAGGALTAIDVRLTLPHDFPPKYVDAIRRSIDHCAVKRQMTSPTEFRLNLVESETLASA